MSHIVTVHTKVFDPAAVARLPALKLAAPGARDGATLRRHRYRPTCRVAGLEVPGGDRHDDGHGCLR